MPPSGDTTTLYSSYLDAYMSSPEKAPRAVSASPASTTRYATMSHGPMTFPLQRSPNQPISTMNQRVPVTPSRKNVENMDTQYECDKMSFDKRANTYRRLAGEKYHHNKPLNSILTLWEEGHIADRGKARVAGELDKGLYDPILSNFKINPAGGQSMKKQRPVSAPHARPTSPSPSAAHRTIKRDMGRYNPLTHTYHAENPPSPTHAARKLKEFERANGGPTLGIPAKVDTRGAFNPISGEWKEHRPSSPGAVRAAFNLSTGRGSPHAPVRSPSSHTEPSSPAANASAGGGASPFATPEKSRLGSNGGSGGGGVAAAFAGHGGTPPSQARASSAPHQRASGSSLPIRGKQLQGESWGTYNPIHHCWSVPPKDSKNRDQNGAFNKQHGVSGARYGYTAVPASQGVYNPILNHWTVPPADSRVREGLTFAPATMFSRPTAATIRVK